MKTITLLNEKGGVGKTTLATHLAAGLAIIGLRVVLIDADPQGNSTFALGIRKRGALYNLIVREGEPEGAWQRSLEVVSPERYSPETPRGQLLAVPGNAETRMIPLSTSDVTVFKRRLMELQDAVDVVIIDTAPTPSLLHGSIFAASDYVIIPTQLEAFSAFEGLAASILHSQNMRERMKKSGLDAARLIGIVPTMYRGNTSAHSVAFDYLTETYGDLVWKPLGMRIAYAESALAQRLLYAYDPENAATREMWRFVKQAAGVLGVGA